jgi:hypothetical protein
MSVGGAVGSSGTPLAMELGIRRKLRPETPVWVSWPKNSSKVVCRELRGRGEEWL